ncbi:MAG: hypothetical protein QM537_01730 [Candidatus Symbiobacter sp.]|nr:hypothetical protein [Candidatus Symbiobacter sp.]
MADTIKKPLIYFQVEWQGEENNLELITRKAWSIFTKVEDRDVKLKNGNPICGLSSHDLKEFGFAIRCGQHEKGKPIPFFKMEGKENAEILSIFTEDDQEILDTDFFALIKDNNIIVLNAGQSASRLTYFLKEIFKKANFSLHFTRFNIYRLPNVEIYNRIRSVGVKYIDLNIKGSDSLDRNFTLQSTGFANIIKQASSKFNNILFSHFKSPFLIENAKTQFRVKFDFANNTIASIHEESSVVAQEIVKENPDGTINYRIILRDGFTITLSDTFLNKEVEFNLKRGFISESEVWQEMKIFYSELSRDEINQITDQQEYSSCERRRNIPLLSDSKVSFNDLFPKLNDDIHGFKN